MKLNIAGVALIGLFFFVPAKEAAAWPKKVSIKNETARVVDIRVFDKGRVQRLGAAQTKIWKLNLGDNPTFHVYDMKEGEIYAKQVGILTNPFTTYTLYWTGTNLTDQRPD